MNELDHWQPVVATRAVGKKPRMVRIAGEEIVLFRTERGSIGALVDRCPHRAARLSLGHVEGETLVCPYHGWKWATDGHGRAPGTPTAKPCASAFDVVENQGLVWIKRAGAAAAFPRFDVEGFYLVTRSQRTVDAPLELVLDNFIEVEHTPQVHALLGYPADRMHEVTCTTTTTPESVHVHNIGPQRTLPSPLYPIFDIPRDAWFVDEWTTYFSPVHTVYDQYFVDPVTRRRTSDLNRIGVFFTPLDDHRTDLHVLAYSSASPWGTFGFNAVRHRLLDAFIRMETWFDARLLGSLADKNPAIKGNALGRFDKPLLAARERVERIYRGRGDAGGLRVIREAPSRT